MSKETIINDPQAGRDRSVSVPVPEDGLWVRLTKSQAELLLQMADRTLTSDANQMKMIKSLKTKLFVASSQPKLGVLLSMMCLEHKSTGIGYSHRITRGGNIVFEGDANSVWEWVGVVGSPPDGQEHNEEPND